MDIDSYPSLHVSTGTRGGVDREGHHSAYVPLQKAEQRPPPPPPHLCPTPEIRCTRGSVDVVVESAAADQYLRCLFAAAERGSMFHGLAMLRGAAGPEQLVPGGLGGDAAAAVATGPDPDHVAS